MIPVDQRITEQGKGDCLRCCVASLLELNYENVPDFKEFGSNWFPHFVKFLEKNGYEYFYMGSVDKNDTKELEEEKGVDGYTIVNGPSYRFPGIFHSVIYRYGKIVHDPHPSKTGIPSIRDFFIIRRKEETNEIIKKS